MRRVFCLTSLLAVAIALSGCGYTPEQRAASGAVIGGASGAAIGAAAGRGAAPALIGGALGAATGAIVGANTRPPPPPDYYPPPPPPPRCAHIVYDPYGAAFCAEGYGY